VIERLIARLVGWLITKSVVLYSAVCRKQGTVCQMVSMILNPSL